MTVNHFTEKEKMLYRLDCLIADKIFELRTEIRTIIEESGIGEECDHCLYDELERLEAEELERLSSKKRQVH